MLSLKPTKQFKKDYKKVEKRGKDLAKLEEIIELLVNNKPLPAKNRNHKLKGEYSDCWECHIEPDWLLVYIKTDKDLILLQMGSHSDLF